ncbi:MAG: 4-phosphoerythronate dehydrogenase [Rikenellaceae bacterium]
MKIIIDKAIPFIKGVFEPHCSVEYLDGDKFTAQRVADASALLIRTRTRCNKELLEGSSVSHIATATIGFDHIDTAYCNANGIGVSTAAGCNARAVLQWFGAVVAHLSSTQGWNPQERVLGVVGVGNVGSLVCQYAKAWGFEVICCDPPRKEREGGDFVSFEELASRADIITLHTPLSPTTHHLINAQTLRLISPRCIILNSSRGEVVETKALTESGNKFVLDVWENEPNIDPRALEQAELATPHIAGYSLQGKANASTMAVQNIARALRLPLTTWQSDVEGVEPKLISWDNLCKSIDQRFDIEAQSDYLKAHAEQFEELRNNYNYREEYF